MARFRLLGPLAVLCIVALVVGALWSLSVLFTGDYVSSAGVVLGVVIVVVGSGVVVGRRTDRWTDNPYW
ncbi:hypothetical protein ACFPYI_16890 [Halomarina salina]|uniref:Uncharacterized protein n=1 Tax=Halomarina salina TaxID=1872699 RepID=A0ABD5RR46_9EURY|nr:hypothetical protein [Halomarina salina]